MRNSLDENLLDVMAEFLKNKLSEHSDSISIEDFQYLFGIDKNKVLIKSALEYANDANVKVENIAELNSLIEKVGNKIDQIQSEYNIAKNGKLAIILRDLQMIHFGLIGISLFDYWNKITC